MKESKEIFINYLVDTKYSKYRRAILFSFLLVITIGLSIATKNIKQVHWWFAPGTFVLLAAPILFNLYFFLPQYLFKARYKAYAIVLILSLLVFYTLLTSFSKLGFVKPSDETPFNAGAFAVAFIFYLLFYGTLIAATSAVKLFQRWVNDTYRLMQLENSFYKTELDLLKTNISPHFLFNMLNNIDVLIGAEPKKARKLVIELSDFIRYQLYDSQQEKVFLHADIEFLIHFLEMEKIRRDHFRFTVENHSKNSELIEVPPLLFIPFVENAVKHNVDSKEANVYVSFSTNNHHLVFICTNPVNKHKTHKVGGLGLPTVKRRLELLYPGKHTLDISEGENTFHVILNIKL
ncbi:sensor histidine kinase [Pinibacter aurantiacus]|uniref:Histidine kinase n=1 Tax=Pinibacter aurantiacus TaxID=2851599 RepID=A0A9E2W8M1_9BACT|nr:histidine kinase [Pinibacter aurantiacus]MBV4358726.1 histidine kinase [Pinibacter aurantiacus]